MFDPLGFRHFFQSEFSTFDLVAVISVNEMFVIGFVLVRNESSSQPIKKDLS